MPDLPDENQNNQEKFHFDVATQNWLPIVRGGGGDEVGLIEALCQAHEMDAIRDPMPPVECGLLRLLVAFALDIFQPQNEDDWEDVWHEKKFDAARVREYFAEYSQRFDLFDEKFPFLQDASVEGGDKPLAGLLPALPAGTNAAHFHHGDEDDFGVSPAVAARLLTTIAPFMTAGGAGLSPSINGAPPWYVMLRGDNLFQTIWLNGVANASLKPKAKNDCPAWRDTRPIIKEDRTETGLLEALTWRPRRIRLVPRAAENERCALSGNKTAVLVDRMKFSAAWSTRFEWRDPNVPYRITDKGRGVLRPREGREFWRDVGGLALLRESESSGSDVAFERPGIVTQFADFVRGGDRLPENTPLRLSIYGMRTDLKMKVFEWHRETLNLPAPLVLQSRFQLQAQSEIKRAEDVAYQIARAIKHTYPRDGAGNDKAFDALIARAQSQFWQRLRLHYTDNDDSLLFQLAKLQPTDDAAIHEVVERWHESLAKVARGVLGAAIGELDTDGEAMKRMMEARRYFESRLWALLHPEAAAQARKNKKEKKDE